MFYYGFLSARITKDEVPKSSIVLKQLPEITGIKRIYLNLMFGSIFVGTAFILEHYIPYKNDLITPNGLRHLVNWSPALCGVGIGSLQLFFMMLFKKSLGISTGLTVLVAQLCRIKFFKKLMPSLESFAYGVPNSTALLFALGAVGGSFMATVSANQYPLNEQYGAGVMSSFFGGFLLSLGARCAGGCTSGQGISGKCCFLNIFIIFDFVYYIQRCHTSFDWFSHCNRRNVWWWNAFCYRIWFDNKRLAISFFINISRH